MESYDPLRDPDPDEWLALDEDERVGLIADYHEEAGVHLPTVRLHALIHATVENQLATDDPPEVQKVLEKLLADGLDRHEAIHAIGAVLSEQLFSVLKDPSQPTQAGGSYLENLATLTAEKWLASGKG